MLNFIKLHVPSVCEQSPGSTWQPSHRSSASHVPGKEVELNPPPSPQVSHVPPTYLNSEHEAVDAGVQALPVGGVSG